MLSFFGGGGLRKSFHIWVYIHVLVNVYRVHSQRMVRAIFQEKSLMEDLVFCKITFNLGRENTCTSK